MSELRCEIDDSILAVVDAHSSALGGVGRKQIIEEVLLAWAKDRHHEATLILRVAGDNPIWPETKRK